MKIYLISIMNKSLFMFSSLGNSSRLWITTTPQSSSITVVESSINELSALPAGWALKQKREVKRFGSEMCEWVKAHFINGERTGKKVTGEDLNRLQRTEFTVDEWRTATQFKSLLSRMSAEYRETGFDEVDETEVDVGGGIEAYEDAVEEAMELNGRIADIEVNNYVAVDYGAYWQWLPGVVEQINKTTCTIRSMKRLSTENSFTWPDLNEPAHRKDFGPVEINMNDILAILEPPTLKSRYWSFSNEDMKKIKSNL